MPSDPQTSDARFNKLGHSTSNSIVATPRLTARTQQLLSALFLLEDEVSHLERTLYGPRPESPKTPLDGPDYPPPSSTESVINNTVTGLDNVIERIQGLTVMLAAFRESL